MRQKGLKTINRDTILNLSVAYTLNIMKHTIFNLFLSLIISFSSTLIYAEKNNTSYPFYDKTLSVEERIEDLVSRMTIEEKIDLLSGYNDFYLHPCERLGIPAFKMADGPLGLSSWGLWGRATAFPSALSVASSWNRSLAAEIGKSYAEEWRSRGIHFLLAPGANIYRASKGARNFEYYGEDPYLTSKMVVPFIKSVQDGGVIATIKHFVGNDQEFDRYTVSTEVSDRALHEIYLAPFKAAVLEADVKAVMTGYNPVSGIYCTENKKLIDILKKEWGFKGILMSDWACTYSADKAANNGLDLEMGSKNWFNKEKLIPLIEKGIVTENVINEKVRRIYGTCIEMGFFDRAQKIDSIPIYNAKANEVALKTAEEGIVLLKNNGILPLKSPKRIAIIGPTANPPIINDRVFSVNGIVYGGGGSSRVHPWYVVNDFEGIKNKFPDAEILYAEGISNQFKKRLFANSVFRTKDGNRGLHAKYYSIKGTDSCSLNSISEALLQEQAKAAGRNETEGIKNKPQNKLSGNLVIERNDRNVNFEWWGYPEKNELLGTDYEIEWDGYVDVVKSDSLRFFVDAQGGYQLFIDDILVEDAVSSQSFHVSSNAVLRKKGDKVHVRLKFSNQRSMPAEIRMGYCYDSDIDFSEARKIAAISDVVILCVGLDGSIELEGRDRPFLLPFGQDMLINDICKINSNTIVVMHAGGGVDMTKWIDNVPAVLHAFYPGQEGGNALGNILSGKVNPSAKLPFTIEKKWSDSPSYGNYDETRKEKKVYYNEGIFVGYRGYEKNNIEPLFPFGYGLSYTTFEYGNLFLNLIDKKSKTIEAKIDITNTGNVPGAEIVQFYIEDVESGEERPIKELKGFDKVWLKPGETKSVSVKFSKEDFMYYSEVKNRWIFEEGLFYIKVGSSSKDIREKEEIDLH